MNFNDLLPEEEPKRRNDGDIRAGTRRACASVGRRDQAAEQARQALVDNDKFAADDPRRLND